MDTPAAASLFRSALRCIALIMITWVTSPIPAQASGSVSPTSITYWNPDNYSTYGYGAGCGGMESISAIQSCQLSKYSGPGYCSTQLTDYGASNGNADRFDITYSHAWVYWLLGWPVKYLCEGVTARTLTFYIRAQLFCPEHAQPTQASCTCTNPYMPDASGTSCAIRCPDNASGTYPNCTCNADFKPNPAGYGCIPEQITISLSGLGGEVLPGKTRSAHAKVTTSSGAPKSGAQVTLLLTVVPDNGEAVRGEHVGRVSPNGGGTGTDGKLPFVFAAPSAGGVHTIHAFCTTCANYSEESIKVSGCPVEPLSAPPFDDACAAVLENTGATQAQKVAACGALTDNLKEGMACLRGKLADMSPALTLKITSDIRSIAYQAHLRQVWNRMEDVVDWMAKNPSIQTACTARRTEIAAEKGCDNAGPCTSCYAESASQRSHCLAGRPASPNPNDAKHTQGNAFDVSRHGTVDLLQAALDARNPPQKIPQFLDAPPTNCNLNWGGTFTGNFDPVHFYAR